MIVTLRSKLMFGVTVAALGIPGIYNGMKSLAWALAMRWLRPFRTAFASSHGSGQNSEFSLAATSSLFRCQECHIAAFPPAPPAAAARLGTVACPGAERLEVAFPPALGAACFGAAARLGDVA